MLNKPSFNFGTCTSSFPGNHFLWPCKRGWYIAEILIMHVVIFDTGRLELGKFHVFIKLHRGQLKHTKRVRNVWSCSALGKITEIQSPRYRGYSFSNADRPRPGNDLFLLFFFFFSQRFCLHFRVEFKPFCSHLVYACVWHTKSNKKAWKTATCECSHFTLLHGVTNSLKLLTKL